MERSGAASAAAVCFVCVSASQQHSRCRDRPDRRREDRRGPERRTGYQPGDEPWTVCFFTRISSGGAGRSHDPEEVDLIRLPEGQGGFDPDQRGSYQAGEGL